MKLLLAFVVAVSFAQEPKKKPVTKKQAAHAKPTPEQIRKFNQLQAKQKK